MCDNKLMNSNCACQPGVSTSPTYNQASSCGTPPTQLTTVTIKADEGDDSATAPYAPRLGAWQNTIVHYLKNNAVYLYDVNGVYTNLTGTDWGTTINNLQEALTALQGTVTANKSEADEAIAALQAANATQDATIASLTQRVETENTNLTNELASLTSQVTNVVAVNTNLQSALATETAARESADSTLTDNLAAEAAARANADTALQTAIDAATTAADNAAQAADTATASTSREVVLDVTTETDASTANLVLSTAPLNQSATTEVTVPLPVASSTQAGIMNMSMYNQLQTLSDTVNAIQGSAVEINDLAADASQEDLSDAWKLATGNTELVNQAKIYDSANDKIWTYYANTEQWTSQPASGMSISVDTATNDSLGIVMGSSEDGQIAVESDGRMSLNGYDTLVGDVTTLQSAVFNLQDIIGDIQTAVARLDNGTGAA